MLQKQMSEKSTKKHKKQKKSTYIAVRYSLLSEGRFFDRIIVETPMVIDEGGVGGFGGVAVENNGNERNKERKSARKQEERVLGLFLVIGVCKDLGGEGCRRDRREVANLW